MSQPIQTLLIANRGEIACRIIETARRLGIKTVAVFSEADTNARHVTLADEALGIGPAPAADSYLNIDAILRAASATGADAIHPGYGFLSENPEFVERVAAAGLIFVGPSAEVVRSMGLKDRAKALMAEAGVPVVPGYHGVDQSDQTLLNAAKEVGYPVLIKAVAGGGGKGMRVVGRPEDFAAALSSARSEAQAAFGNDDVLIEKLVQSPRHIEVQVFGDGQKAIHLFERDCSLQRRHQKVLEEAPAPGMSEAMRAAMGAAAVRAAEAVGYRGAGTVEFIVDASDGLRPDRFWFMEMNTRLQVEHPVTEAITGVDLVEWQLRVAGGEPLPLAQGDLRIDGHAVEVRLYAEDPTNGFLPATGRLDHLVFSDRARVDTGVVMGDTISSFYDPMIAKLIVHGKDRTEAFEQMGRALSETEISGSITNLDFLSKLVTNDDVQAGRVDTGLIERDADALTAIDAPSRQARAIAVATAMGSNFGSGFALWRPLRHILTLGGRQYAATVSDQVYCVEVGGEPHRVERDGETWRVDGAPTNLRSVRTSMGISVFGTGGGHFPFSDPLDRRPEQNHGDGQVRAPMPGRVIGLAAGAGDMVEAGEGLAVLEAMKMEHTLTAPISGRVAEVVAVEGALVEAKALLFRIEEEGGE